MRASPTPVRGRVFTALAFALLGTAHLILPTSVTAQNAAADTASEARGQRGWLGIAFQDPDARSPTPPGRGRDGVVVSGILRGGPADRAGIRPGHVLVELDGERVGPRELGRRARSIRVGDSVTLTVRGSGGEREVELVAGPRPESVPPALDPEVMARVDSIQDAVRQRLDALRDRMRGNRDDEPAPASPWPPRAFDSGDGPPDGRDPRSGRPAGPPTIRRPPRPYSLGHDFVAGARMVTLNDLLAEYFEAERGVLTVDVLDGSPAQEAGLRPGDVIVAVDDEEVETVEDLRSALMGRRGPGVELQIVRQGEGRTIRLPS